MKINYEQKYHFRIQFKDKENLQLAGDRKNIKNYIPFLWHCSKSGYIRKTVLLGNAYFR